MGVGVKVTAVPACTGVPRRICERFYRLGDLMKTHLKGDFDSVMTALGLYQVKPEHHEPLAGRQVTGKIPRRRRTFRDKKTLACTATPPLETLGCRVALPRTSWVEHTQINNVAFVMGKVQ